MPHPSPIHSAAAPQRHLHRSTGITAPQQQRAPLLL